MLNLEEIPVWQRLLAFQDSDSFHSNENPESGPSTKPG